MLIVILIIDIATTLFIGFYLKESIDRVFSKLVEMKVSKSIDEDGVIDPSSFVDDTE
jgi:hypothetical protein